MKFVPIGKIVTKGCIDPSAILFLSGSLFALQRWREETVIVAGAVDFQSCTLKPVWSHKFTGNVFHLWCGQKTFINSPSILDAGNGRILLIGGGERLLVDAQDGQIVKKSTSGTSPSAMATIVDNRIIVPEGQSVSTYDVKTLQLLDRKPTPDDKWALAPLISDMLILQDERDGSAMCWDIFTNKTSMLADVDYPVVAAILYQNWILVPSDGAIPGRLSSFDLQTKQRQWTFEYPAPEPKYPQAGGNAIIPNPALLFEDNVVVITATPSVESIAIAQGSSVWRYPLSTDAACIVLISAVIWVGTVDGSVMAMSASDGTLLASYDLDGVNAPVVAIIECPADAEKFIVLLIVDRNGIIYKLTTDISSSL